MLKHMSQPITIKGKTIKNRFTVPAMVTNYCNEDGTATEQFIAYLEEKAKGGFGLIITEDYAIDPLGKGFKYLPGLWCDGQIESHKELTKRVHKYGATILAQIYHCGRQTSVEVIGEVPKAPTAIPCPFSPDMPYELTIKEIENIIEEYGDCARRAKECGFDGVEIHGAHGYLIAEFMSPYSNKRTDRYGGNLANRLRFPLAIIRNIREKCGEDFIIDFRISGDECVSGGRNIGDTRAIAPLLVEAGVDLIHVTAGVYKSFDAIIPSNYTGHAWIADFAAEIKKVVDVPVISVGRYNDPIVAEQVLAAGKADMISMGRQSLSDPYTPNKAMEGKFDEIRTCIACHQGCVGKLMQNQPIECILNPTLGKEYCTEIKKAEQVKNVAVVGAGPAGLEVAIIAASRGHKVTVFEKDSHVGGQFRLAAIPPCKGEIAGYIAWQMRELEKLNVEVNLNTEINSGFFENKEFDEIIVATGANPVVPRIKGIDSANVVAANDVLSGAANVGFNNVVIGGGQVGAEVANHLGVQLKNVAVVEMREGIALEEEIVPRWGLLRDLEKNKVSQYVNASVTEITEKSVKLLKDGQEIELPADTVVIAIGSRSNNILAEELKAKKYNVKVIGDSMKVRQAGQAIQQGFKTANEL